jgi:hypothetical protein
MPLFVESHLIAQPLRLGRHNVDVINEAVEEQRELTILRT